MPGDLAALRAEIARLRGVCEAHDIDPDWQPDEPVHTVPPPMETMMSALTRAMLLGKSGAMINRILDGNPRLRRWRNMP